MEHFLVHHGIKGQKWGIRRYQNADGTLTNEGRKRYGGSNKTVVITGGKTTKNSKLNKINSKEDYWSQSASYDIMDEYDSIGITAANKYKTEGKKAVKEYLNTAIKDSKYEYEISNGNDYVNFKLKVIGNDIYYKTFGEEDYTDDQTFGSIKQDKKRAENERQKEQYYKNLSAKDKKSIKNEYNKTIDELERINMAMDDEHVKNEAGEWESVYEKYYNGKSYDELLTMSNKLEKKVNKIANKIPTKYL